jgi:hypothetical protein
VEEVEEVDVGETLDVRQTLCIVRKDLDPALATLGVDGLNRGFLGLVCSLWMMRWVAW